MSTHDEAPVVDVPYTAINDQTLRALIEEFITRSGTDYGVREASLDSKVADVRRQLERGDARIVFDTATGTTNILPKP